MPTTLTNGIQLPDKGSVDWYSSMQSNYNLIDTHLGDTDVHVTAEDKDNWNSKQGSLSQDQLDAIAQVATNTDDIATLQSDKADASHTHSSSDITDIDDYATKDYVDNSISGLVDNAPDALNTLNELSAALNDDSNFASTVTTALAAKADSADLATVATSGSYDDLDDKPTIPTNTSDLTNDSGFVTLNDFDIPSKTSDLTNDSGFITLNDVPTGTSDLINDSNFVDTSNAAVSSGITSAKVSDYDTHIADTDIHVTTADKNRWNNQTYVFRYSSTALTDSSTNSNTLLDNTDNLKVGDKVIDSSGVLFSITAIDTANSTFTIGTALIDLAQDSDVVHKSGDETISGSKIFDSNTFIYNSDNTATTPYLFLKNSKVTKGSTSERGAQLLKFVDKNNNNLCELESIVTSTGSCELRLRSNTLDSNNQNVQTGVTLISSLNGGKNFCPTSNNDVFLGASTLKWARVYATNYYYGNDNVEFSIKFVTTDTNQTISGAKTFSSNVNVYNSDSATDTANIVLKNSKAERGSTTDIGEQNISFVDKNNNQLGNIKCITNSSGVSNMYISCNASGNDNGVRLSVTSNTTYFRSNINNNCKLGTADVRWSDVQTYKVNALEPSSLSLPSGDASNFIDISSYFTDTGSNTNSYTASANGWIFLRLGNLSGCQATVFDANSNRMWGQSVTGKVEQITIPILKGQTFTTEWATTSSVDVAIARFIPCQGNV